MCCLVDEEEWFDEEEFEEEPKKKLSKPTKTSLEQLKTLFDVVDVEKKEYFDVLTCKNKVNNHPFIEYEVWLSLKVKKYNTSYNKDDGIEKAAAEIIKHQKKLFENKKSFVQIGLFEEEKPKNIYESLTFFQCFNNYCLYDEDLYIHTLPKSDEEMLLIVKNSIEKYLAEPDKEFDEFTIEKYFIDMQNKAMSDRDIITKIYSNVRVKFGLYKEYEDFINVDDSYTVHIFERDKNKMYSKCEARYYSYEYQISLDSHPTLTYDLNKPHFVKWLREKLNIRYKAPKSDDEVIKESLERLANNMYPGTKDENFDIHALVNSCKTEKEFKTKFTNLITSHPNYRAGHMGGFGYPDDDCYSINGGYDINHLSLGIKQKTIYRKMLGREVTESDYTMVYEIKDNKIYTEMYKHLNLKPQYVQTTLF